MLATLALLLLTQAPAPKLASPGLTAVRVSKDVAAFYSDHLAQQLALRGLTVVTSSEIQSLLGFERQKQLMGCSDSAASCLAELANALGVDGIITGSIGRFDEVFQINIKVVAANDAHQLAVFSASVEREGAVIGALGRAAEQMAPDILEALGRTPKRQPISGMRRWSWVPAAAGVIALAAGTGLMWHVSAAERALRGAGDTRSTLSVDEARRTLAQASTEQVIGIALLAVGGVAAAGSLLMFLLGAPHDVSASAFCSPRGDAAFVLAVPWP